MNALKHGLRSASAALANENHAAFQTLLDEYSAALSPAGPIQRDLVRELAVTRWRLDRIVDVEAAMIDDEMDRQAAAIAGEYAAIDEPTRIARALRSLSAGWAFTLVGRAEARLRRAYIQTFALLARMRTNEPSPVSEQ